MTNYYYQIKCTKCDCIPCKCNPSLTYTTTTNGYAWLNYCDKCGSLPCRCITSVRGPINMTFNMFPVEENKPKTMKELIESLLDVLDKNAQNVVELTADEVGDTKVFKIVVKEK